MKASPRILILYITEHSGHHSAGLAIRKALQEAAPSGSFLCVNAFRHAFPFAERLIHWTYMLVIRRLPGIWGAMYDNKSLVDRSHGLKKWVHDLGIRRLQGLIDSFKPDAVVCTQAFPCGIVADFKARHRSALPLFGVLTDLSPHDFWVYDKVDHYIVHCQPSLEKLIEKGVLLTKIKTLGIPIDPKFAVAHDRAELAGNFGLEPRVPTVLIMGGGRGLGDIRQILTLLDSSPLPLQLIVVCGLNKALYDWVHNQRFQKKILKFRYTDQVDRLMSLASVVVTKPGGITTAEALAKRLPMIILHPIPGQETRNAEMLVSNGLAFRIDSPQELPQALEKVLVLRRPMGFPISLSDPWSAFSKPRSSVDIARFVLGQC